MENPTFKSEREPEIRRSIHGYPMLNFVLYSQSQKNDVGTIGFNPIKQMSYFCCSHLVILTLKRVCINRDNACGCS